jgi:hypothetical protein
MIAVDLCFDERTNRLKAGKRLKKLMMVVTILEIKPLSL